MPVYEYDRRGNLISTTHSDGRPYHGSHFSHYPDYCSSRSHHYSGFPSRHSRDRYYNRVSDFYAEGDRLYREVDRAHGRSRRTSDRLEQNYIRDLEEGASYYEPPEFYYKGRCERSAPRGGYGPPYDYYDGAWRDGFGHDVTNPPHYSRDDETGHWSYSWPGRGRGEGY